MEKEIKTVAKSQRAQCRTRNTKSDISRCIIVNGIQKKYCESGKRRYYQHSAEKLFPSGPKKISEIVNARLY